MKLFLDDIREAPEGWEIVRSGEEAIILLGTNVVEMISLDNDLGSNKMTGYDVTKWIEKQVFENNFIPPDMVIHSANLVGRKNMLSCIDRILRKVKNGF